MSPKSIGWARGRRLTPTGSLLQLGYGVHQKRVRASETSGTSALAVEVCQEKPLTNHLLRMVGLPVPDGRIAETADEAWTIAAELGLPVVVKPDDGNQGKGVTLNLRSEAEVRHAYALARELVAAARRDVASVLGDGRRTIVELIGEVNRDPRRRPGHNGSLTRLELDD